MAQRVFNTDLSAIERQIAAELVELPPNSEVTLPSTDSGRARTLWVAAQAVWFSLTDPDSSDVPAAFRFSEPLPPVAGPPGYTKVVVAYEGVETIGGKVIEVGALTWGAEPVPVALIAPDPEVCSPLTSQRAIHAVLSRVGDQVIADLDTPVMEPLTLRLWDVEWDPSPIPPPPLGPAFVMTGGVIEGLDQQPLAAYPWTDPWFV